MSSIDDMASWLKTVIPAEYVGSANRWTDIEPLAQSRMWCIYQDGGLVEGSIVARPYFRVVLFGKREDSASQELLALAESIYKTAKNAIEYTDAGCLCRITPIGWINGIGYTEEKRPFLEMNFNTMIG